MARTSIYFDAATLRMLDILARRLGMSRSRLVRRLIREALEPKQTVRVENARDFARHGGDFGDHVMIGNDLYRLVKVDAEGHTLTLKGGSDENGND